MKIAFLSLCFAAAASAAELTGVQKDNYLISGCGDQTDTIVALLDQALHIIQLVLENPITHNFKNPTPSAVFYEFFMAVGSTAVDNILWKIALGADIRRDGEYSQPNIVCANSQLSEVAKQAHVCENPGVQATVIPGYRYVFLCQRILDLPRVPRATDCAGARSGGHVATGQGLARTQMGILLHQLVDVYLASDPGGMKPLKPQIFGLHAALKLPSTQSVVNPANYVFYIMNLVRQCQSFSIPESIGPSEQVPVEGGTSAVAAEATPNSSCAGDPLLGPLSDCPGVKATDTFVTVARVTSGSWRGAPQRTPLPPIL